MKLRFLFPILASAVFAQSSWQPPSDDQRCPSQWGPGDQRGSANLMTPSTVLRAAKLIESGEVFELGHVLGRGMPSFGTRRFDIHLKRTTANAGSNRRGDNEEIVITELGQVGTQLDGLAHQTIGDKLYNCFKLEEVTSRYGFNKLGIENAGFLMTRGVLIDLAGLKGVEILPARYEISVADLQAALKKQAITLEPGDAVIINTGLSRLWGKDNARYASAAAGIGVAAAEWLARQNPMLVGADTPAIEVVPYPDKTLNAPVHQLMLVVNGIHLLENLNLGDLAAKRVYEFAFMLQPLKIQGGSGSTVAPVAVR